MESPIWSCCIKGKISDIYRYSNESKDVFIGIGDNQSRLDIMSSLKNYSFKFPTLVALFSSVSPSAEIGEGILVAEGAIIKANAKIGDGCIINTGAIVEHDCIIKQGAHLSPCSTLGGECYNRKSCMVGGSVKTKPPPFPSYI